jgi:fucokinase
MANLFDIVVLTAANEAQAAGYREQLAARENRGLLPRDTTWFVVSDPGGRRVGSGGSTVQVLADIASTHLPKGTSFHERFRGQRILIVHSGGDARRIPAYAAQGKVFLPLPCDIIPPERQAWETHPATLFDVLLQTMARLPASPDGEVLICSGDVLLTFNPDETNLHTSGGITGLGFSAPPVIAQHHGVYVTEHPSVGGVVSSFLQKPHLERMIEAGAMDDTGRVLVDTGVICLAPPAVEALLNSCGIVLADGEVVIGPGLHRDLLEQRVDIVDVYQEILLALPATATVEDYRKNLGASNQTPEAQRSLTHFFERIHSHHLPFNVSAVADGEFFHVGTSNDLLSKFTVPSRTSRRLDFTNGHRTQDLAHHGRHVTSEAAVARGLTVFNTVCHFDHQVPTENGYIEGCEIGGSADYPDSNFTIQLDRRSFLIGLTSRAWQNAEASLKLPEGIGLFCLPLQSTTVAAQNSSVPLSPGIDVPVLFGVHDDNKGSYESGKCYFLNQPIQHLLDAGLTSEQLWPDSTEHSTWTAKFWLAGAAGWRAVHLLLEIMAERKAESSAKVAEAVAELQNLWQNQPRWSLAEMSANVDHRELLRHRHYLATRAEHANLLNLLLQHDDLSIDQLLKHLSGEQSPATVAAKLVHNLEYQFIETAPHIETLPLLKRARLQQAVAVLAEKAISASPPTTPHEIESPVSLQEFRDIATSYNSAAVSSVRQVLESAIHLVQEPRPAAVLHDQAVWVTAPGRIDFAGGWSDTPPICLELGGTVLNAAVTVNGQYPIQVVAKLNKDACIRLTSIDLGRQEVYREASDINGPPDLNHWSSLAKAALVLSGIVPDTSSYGHSTTTNKSLADWLQVLGGGLDLTLFSGLPKGSGMGTSSILGAAVLACLARVLGQELTHAELIAQTSLLEQRMTSGGGWQDQIGGIVAGVKLIRTQPGLEQVPSLEWSVFGGTGDAAERLQRRMLLYFTGHKRVAQNILQHVVAGYLARDTDVLRIVHELKDGAESAKQALASNDVAAFARGLSQYWELKKSIDAGSTNEHVESILQRVQPYTSAASLCGAGGGGFMLMLAHDEEAAHRIRHTLQADPPHERARFFDFAVDTKGLVVTVL